MKDTTKEWDGRPDNVCQKCGYHTCCCKLQEKTLASKPPAKPSTGISSIKI